MLTRFVNTVIFGVSNSVLYLSMEKPFNPILGETFQCWINGCPAYAEQISHHPPIAALIFKGRGYEVTGTFDLTQPSYKVRCLWVWTAEQGRMTAYIVLNLLTEWKYVLLLQEVKSAVWLMAIGNSTWWEKVFLSLLSIFLDYGDELPHVVSFWSLQEGIFFHRKAGKAFRLYRRYNMGGAAWVYDKIFRREKKVALGERQSEGVWKN